MEKRVQAKRNELKYAAAVVILFISCVILLIDAQNKRKEVRDLAEKVNDTSLLDTIQIVKYRDRVVYRDGVTIYPVDYILNSPQYKQLQEKEQKWIKELDKTRELLFAAYSELESAKEKLESYEHTFQSTDSTVVVPIGDTIKLSDTLDVLSYEQQIQFTKTEIRNYFKYRYNADIRIKMYRDKNLVIAEWELNDPNAVIKKGQSIYPVEYELKEDKRKRLRNYMITGIAGVALGVYIGTELK